MKKDNAKTIKHSFKDLLNLLDGFSTADDYHANFDIFVQTVDKGFVKSFEFDKDFQEPCLFHLNNLSRFIYENHDKIVTTRLKFDLIVIDK